MMENLYELPLNGMAAGRTTLRWHAGKEFFESYENTEILDADLSVEVTVEKSGRFIGVDCNLEGSVTTLCDRCLEPLQLPVSEKVLLSVKFGAEPSEGASDGMEGSREIVYLDASDAVLDMAQVIYDYTCLALPLHRVHPDGECNPETVRFLGTQPENASPASDGEPSQSPFAALKDLF